MEVIKLGLVIGIGIAFCSHIDAKGTHIVKMDYGTQSLVKNQMLYFNVTSGGCDCNSPSCEFNCPPESHSFCCTEGREGDRRCCPNDFPVCCMTDRFVQYCCDKRYVCCDTFCC